MFSKNKTYKSTGSLSPASQSLSIISASAQLKGQISIEDDLRIDGNVEGDITSSGKIVIGPEGCVRGKITGNSVEVVGKIIGDVVVSDIVILRSASYYEGKITARNVEIEAGASFFGNCMMEKEEKIKNTENKNIILDNMISPIPVIEGIES